MKTLMLTWLIVAASLVAQTAPSVRPAAPSRVLYDRPEADRLFAMGRNYKAELTAEGLTFVPFLGADAPENHPVRFALAAVNIGTVGRSPAPAKLLPMDHDRATLDHGLVIERLDFGMDGVEQSFVLESRPEISGDLALDLTVGGKFEAEAGSDGILLAIGDRGGVRYGRATAIAADGRRLDLETVVIDGGIRIVVPESFVKTARFPLVIDPLISTVSTLAGTAIPFLNTDTAEVYDYSGPVFDYKFFVVYESVFSNTDHDMFALTTDSTGATLVGPVAVDFSFDDWRAPRAAASQIAQINGVTDADFLVCAQVYTVNPYIGSGFQSRIFVRKFRAQDLFAGAPLNITPGMTLTGACSEPDAGGDASFTIPAMTAPGNWCIVFTYATAPGNRDILEIILDSALNPVGAPIAVANTPRDESNAAISISNGHDDGIAFPGTQGYVVVWQDAFTPTDRDIRGRRLGPDGQPSSAPFAINLQNADDTAPDVSAPLDQGIAGRRVLVAWRRYDAAAYRNEITGALIDGTTVTQIGQISLAADPQLNVFDAGRPHIATDGARFAVAWANLPPYWLWGYQSSWTVATVRAVYGSIVIDDFHTSPQNFSTNDPYVSVASRFNVAPTGAAHHYLVAAISGSVLETHVYAGCATAGGVTTVPTGSGIVGVTWSGAPVLGSYLAFSMTGGTGAAIQVMIIGAPAATPVPVCGPNFLGVDFPGLLTIDSYMTYPLDPYFETVVPPEPLLVGLSIAVQCGAVGITGGCPYPAGPNQTIDIALSDTLVVTFR